jgi:hypothetical protein
LEIKERKKFWIICAAFVFAQKYEWVPENFLCSENEPITALLRSNGCTSRGEWVLISQREISGELYDELRAYGIKKF